MIHADPNSSLLQGPVAFTGKLACMSRTEAFAKVRQLGGVPTTAVSRRTQVLVVGELGWPLLDDGEPSRKLRAAVAHGTAVVSERRFLEWLGQAAPDTSQRVHSAEQTCTLAGLSRDRLDQLVRLGLLDPRDGLFGFRDLAAARQISKLLSAGVSLSTVIRSLHEIRRWLPEAGLANLRLHPDGNGLVVDQGQGRTDIRGQFMLPVDAPGVDLETLFEQAQAAEDGGDLELAERLYRQLMKCAPSDPVPAFNLGNMFRADARKVEAEAAFRAATKADPGFAEGWYNLADVLDEQGRSQEAVACLKRALEAAPGYGDALFNLALLLQRDGGYGEAAQYWRQYLLTDRTSAWASRAKRCLKFCEIQNSSPPARADLGG
jgi:tetratricopeptide (TPR) repeat protein